MDQPILALELHIASIDHGLEVIQRTRLLEHFDALLLRAATLLTRLIVNQGHQCLDFQSVATPIPKDPNLSRCAAGQPCPAGPRPDSDTADKVIAAEATMLDRIGTKVNLIGTVNGL